MTMVECPFCGAAWEAAVQLLEEELPYGEGTTAVVLKVVVPVWTCNLCAQSWTDHIAEEAREREVQEYVGRLAWQRGERA